MRVATCIAALAAITAITAGCTTGLDETFTDFCPQDQCTVCGDGRTLGGEQCDDNNIEDGDGCAATCEIERGWLCTVDSPSLCTASCGDGNVVGTEACDDGGLISDDGCDVRCRVEPGWTCDGRSPSACDLCGNGQVRLGETCDDGQNPPIDGDGCSQRCVVEPGWLCAPGGCAPDFSDAIKVGDEACATGDATAADGCEDGVVLVGWQCSGQGPGSCTPVCGDGLIRGAEGQPGGCDDRNLIDGDGCSVDCNVEAPAWRCEDSEPSRCDGVCGDGVVRGSEAQPGGCDDGNPTDGDGCDMSCRAEFGFVCDDLEPSTCAVVCGDGVLVTGPEACDDGNLVAGDGCDPTCTVEEGYECPVNFCRAICGDQRRLGLETCDDGNEIAGDGCNADCEVEDGCRCSGVGPDSCECLLSSIDSIGAGGAHTCAVLESGAVSCWGDNSFGQLGTGSTSPASADRPQVVPGLTGTGTIAGELGTRHACTRHPRGGGGARCWGGNVEGQLGDPAGSNPSGPTPVSGLSTIRDLTSGGLHTCAVLQDATLSCWGANDAGQLGDGTLVGRAAPSPVVGLTAVLQASAGERHTCALRAVGTPPLLDNRLFCWGANDAGQLGDGTTVSRPSPGQQAAVFATPVQVSAGGRTTCITADSGAVLCWGANDRGQVGDGSTTDAPLPQTVVGANNAVQVSVGAAHACALSRSGAGSIIVCWGANDQGQLGDGTFEDRRSATEVLDIGALTPVDVVAGADHTCALIADGTARCWGTNAAGQLGLGPGAPVRTNRPTPVLR